MHVILFLAMLATPFWDARPPEEWSDEELLTIFLDSPWAQTTEFQNAQPATVYLASAAPMQLAEAEARRRYTPRNRATDIDPLPRKEYEEYLAQNAGKVIILAVREPNLAALARADEIQRMLEESYLKAGRQKYEVMGHFPPAESDPVLRLIFPRPQGNFKSLDFDLYIPGVTAPYRQATFRLKDMVFRGVPAI